MTVASDKLAICPVLIGRTPELEAVYSLIDLAKSGHGRVGLISGEAGLGKSRLVALAKRYALAEGCRLVQGDCFQADTVYPYAPLLDLLTHFFANHMLGPLDDDQERWGREMVRLLPDLGLLLPQFASLPLPQTISPPEQQKRRLFSILTHLFTSLAAQQPILFIVEDVHWCDESSLEFLLHLTRQCKSLPLICLFTYRSEDSSPGLSRWLAQLERERLVFEVMLTPLTQTEIGAMLQAILATRSLDKGLVDAIYSLAEGNPFFVEEVLKTLMATGKLQYVDGMWEHRSKGEPGDFSFIPRSVQDAVRQRVERLSKAAKQTLTLAAVAGRRFDFTLLQQALGCDEGDLLARIKELIAAQFVVEEAADQFAFRHALVQQAINSELLARERKALHRVIAETLEALYATPTQREAHLADLAYHCYAAGMWAKALVYEQRAGEKALALYAPSAAIEHLTRAVGATQQLQITPPSQVYYARGQAYASCGEFDRARHDYEHALDTAQTAADGVMEWQSMMALGFLWASHDYDQAGAWFRRAGDQATHLGDPLLRGRSLNRLGNWLANTGRIEEGLHAHQDALRIFEAQNNTHGMAETFDLLGITYGMRGDRITAVGQLGQAIELFRNVGDTPSLMSSLAMRAIQSQPGASETTFSALRTRDKCVQDAEEAVGLAQHIDSRVAQAFAENALAHTLLAFGEFGPAQAHAQEAQRIATEIEHQQWMVASHYCFGRIYVQLLAPGSAIAALEAGLSLARALGSAFWITTQSAELGLAYILKRDFGAAQVILDAIMPRDQTPKHIAERGVAVAWGELVLAQGEPGLALEIAEGLLASAATLAPGQPSQPIPHLLKLKGEALVALGRFDKAVVALEAAQQGAQVRNARPVLWTIQRSLGQAYERLHRQDEAGQAYAAARQLIKDLATTIDAAAAREQFEQAALDSFPHAKSLLPREAAKRAFGGLTTREREVAALVAQGKTSREIAELLVVSERTAEVHVSNILGKLGFSSRAQIAVWAVEKGLAKP